MGASYGMKGKKHSAETRLILSAQKKGDKNPKWKGGATSKTQTLRNSLQYKEWRAAVFKRDNYTCVRCKIPYWGSLEADHIKPIFKYPKLVFSIPNGRTLCKSCHRKRTKKQLRGVNTKSTIGKYFVS